MSMTEYDFARELEAAFNSVGASVMSADFAAKLLAYVFVMGGGNEAVTMNAKLNVGIAIAQQKFNLYGGEAPSAQDVGLIKRYVAELEKNGKETAWLGEIFERYDFKF